MDTRPARPAWAYLQSWPGVPADVASARHFVADHLRSHSLHSLVDGVALVTSELATNAVRHAGTPFTVTIEQVGDGVLLGVTDGSRVLPRQMPWNQDALSGRGLFLVGVHAQEYGVTPKQPPDEGKLVWARFGFARGRVGAPEGVVHVGDR
jgi:anti-sigma regulatory factor (Ser/Thr protein kinase)